MSAWGSTRRAGRGARAGRGRSQIPGAGRQQTGGRAWAAFPHGPGWCHRRMQESISGVSTIRQQEGQVELGGEKPVCVLKVKVTGPVEGLDWVLRGGTEEAGKPAATCLDYGASLGRGSCEVT